ncbi:type II secretion system F family protein [Limnohabitans sp.]|uniref:type II secretion system F family protein n=1 Tax=Limnohabitans sp. TaxID=1907725 RepID=UPI0038B8D91F
MADPVFKWHGHDREARFVQGTMQAATKDAVVAQLHAQRIRATRVQRQINYITWLKNSARVRPKDITRLTRQLATLLLSGVPLLQAFDIITRGLRQAAIKALVQDLRHQVEEGMPLHQALRRHAAFDALFCNLVAAGEMAGMLDTMLNRLAIHREKSEALRSTLRSALIYPSAVLVIALSVMIFLLSFVVPAFENIFASFDAELPALTRWVVGLSQSWQQHGWAALISTCALMGSLLYAVHRSDMLKERWHGLVLRLPLAGPVVRHACLARWARTLSTLFAAGITLTDALQAVQGVTGNLKYERATQSVRDQLMRGSSLTEAMATHRRLFSSMAIQMCAIGEESGALDKMLDATASHYEREVETAVERLSTLLEPFIMVTLGLLIGGMVVALYLPIFQLGQVV